MNTYPDLAIGWNSSTEDDDGITSDVTQAGTLRSRELQEEGVTTLSIDHTFLLQEEAEALRDFYATNKRLEFLYVWPLGIGGAETYVCRFKQKPTIKRDPADYYTSKVTLLGHAQ